MSTNIPERNLIGDGLDSGEVYQQAETALCIWEHVLDETHRDDRGDPESLYNWMTQEQGVYAGRAAAIDLAWLVERAYRVGHGTEEEYRLDGFAFDWEIVPYIIETWHELFDGPHEITPEIADQLGETLPAALREIRDANRQPGGNS